MFNVYEKCESIDFKGSRNENWLHFPYFADIDDDEDSLTISTQVVIDYIDRGWVGDITLNFVGYTTNDEYWLENKAFQKIKLRDVLCIRRTFSKHPNEAATCKYTFLKY